MMRAWAAISAAAVLVALPVSVQQAAGEPLDGSTGAAGVSTVSTAGTSSVADIGVVLWLSVAVVAAFAASLVLRHSRRLSVADAAGPIAVVPSIAGTVHTGGETLSFVRPDRTAVADPVTGR